MATATGGLTGRSAVAGLMSGLLGAGRRRSAQERADARLGLLLAAPAMLTILLIAVIPLAGTIWDSLFWLSLRFENAPRPFVGLDNYAQLGKDPLVWQGLLVTVKYALIAIPVTTAASLGVAVGGDAAAAGAAQ